APSRPARPGTPPARCGPGWLAVGRPGIGWTPGLKRVSRNGDIFLDELPDGVVLVRIDPGEQDRHLEVIVALIVGVAADHNALGVDTVVHRRGEIEGNAEPGHQRNWLHGMAQHTV